MLTFKSKVNAGYFGKIPQYNDFIKFNAGGPEIILFDEWVQKGINLVKKNMKDHSGTIFHYSSIYNFIFPFTNTANLISGIIKPSFDKNNREYPFIFFVNFPFSLIKIKKYYLLPLVLIPILEKIKKTEINEFEKWIGQLTAASISAAVSAHEEAFEQFLSKPQTLFRDTFFAGNTPADTFTDNLISLNYSGKIPIRVALTCSEENLSNYLSALIMLVSSPVSHFSMPAVFWSSHSSEHNVFISYEAAALNYSDLIGKENSPMHNLNNPVSNQTNNRTAATLLYEDGTIMDFINQIKKIERINA